MFSESHNKVYRASTSLINRVGEGGGGIFLVYTSTEGSMCSHNPVETIIQFLQLEISHKVLIASKT